MPIDVRDYEWWETDELLVVKVPLKGVSSKSIDIFSSDTYIKVSYPPYLFELAPYQPVDDETSKCTITDDLLTLQLSKKTKSTWNTLKHSQHKDKEFMMSLRKEALEQKQKCDADKREKKKTEKDKQKKFAVKEQMRIDELERKQREEAKQLENKQTCQEIEHFTKTTTECEERKVAECKIDVTKQIGKEDQFQNNERTQKEIFATQPYGALEQKKAEKFIPDPRSGGTIQFSFTARQLATPARESKAPEEEAWLQKVAAFNKVKNEAKQKVDADDPEETNPMWLKDKGNSFYKSGNFVAAINAYTTGIILDPRIPMLYANRAACHLHLKQYPECIQDCTMALDYFVPECQANLLSRCRALIRRGSAYFHCELFVESLTDYEAAMKLDPRNDELQLDALRIRNIVQGTASED